ncbi:MAG: ribosomal protein S18-alanine N-acetyltransferase [candidate division WOR-3 bacterium]|nr:MAG: ribosomal protein S18-alanine N-acetyltransferase [candidate division WOR-3 bacterium]
MQRETTIRKMLVKDLKEVYELEVRLFPNPWPLSFFEADLRVPGTVAFVVENQGELIGYSMSTVGKEGFHVTNIAIAQEHQRMGIGSRLMHMLENIARERGCSRAYLEVRITNKSAIKMYEKLGYKIAHVQKLYYMDGDDAYVMEKELV